MFKGLGQQFRQKGSDFGPTCHYEAAGFQMGADERVFSAGEICVPGRPLMICPIDGGFMPVEFDMGCTSSQVPPPSQPTSPPVLPGETIPGQGGSFTPGNPPPPVDDDGGGAPEEMSILKNPWVIGGALSLFLLPLVFKKRK